MKTETLNSYQERMGRVLVHIQNHLDEPMPLDQLAGVASFSPWHFHRIFRGMVGESVKEHVRRLRLERAAQRLKASDRPVLEIALEAGYETHESFTRAFAAMFESSPSAFRSGAQSPRPAPNGSGTPLEVSVRRIGPIRVAFARHVGPFDEVGEAWQRLMMWAGRQGLLGPGVRMVGIVQDDPEITAPEKLRYDAALVVEDGVSASGDIGIQEVGPGEYAVALHVGPYNTLGQTYVRMCGEWLPESGRELESAPAIEFYLNSPMTASPDQLRTEICLPLAV
ncbi:MAG: AraC family transcriptional regulator [Bryobacteraceae bacterium]